MRYSGFNTIKYLKDLVKPYSSLLIFGGRSSWFYAQKEIMLATNGKDRRFILGIRPNPKIEEIRNAMAAPGNYDCIIAIGGGSVIDFAKVFMLLSGQRPVFIAVPTTAGSGSEATRFAVYYQDGIKKTFSDERLIPDHVISDLGLVMECPLAVTGSALLDAYCHATESLWSVRATEESRAFAQQALRYIDFGNYIDAAYYAGRAINISQTTAAHAMSYYLTSKHGIPHGNAVAFTISWFAEIMGQPEVRDRVRGIIRDYGLIDAVPDLDRQEWIDSINIERMSNFPKKLSKRELLMVDIL